MLPISLRTAETEQGYQDSKDSGDLKDINTLKPRDVVAGTRMLDNYFPYDLTYKVSDMSLAFPHESFMTWWMNVGLGIMEGQFADYDQFIFNLPHNQSMPHVPHGHFVNFDKERIEVLRTLLTAWRENNVQNT